MQIETLTEEETVVIRRMTLAPGEKMFWHSDNCRRFTVVVKGEKLAIEYRESETLEEFEVFAGMAGWDEPQPREHRAINTGNCDYEEVVTFYRENALQDPQPQR